jgi:polysaccharide biosynthesis transport protein
MAPARQQEGGLTPAFFLWVLNQWWKIAIPVGLVLAAITGVAILYFYVPIYSASALIDIEHSTPYIAFNQGKSSDSRGDDRYIQTQIELLRSEVVLAPVLSQPEIAQIEEFQDQTDPLKHLKKQLSISQVGKSQLYRVEYTSPSARDATTIANEVVAKYLSLQTDEETRLSQRVIDLLEVARDRRMVVVKQLRNEVLELSKEVTGKDPYGGVTTDPGKSMGPIGALYQSLTEVDVEREVLKAEIQALRDAPTLIPDHAEKSGLLDLNVENHPDIRGQQSVLDTIKDRMDYLKDLVVHWETHDEYVQLQKDFESESKKLADLKTMLRQEMSTERTDTRDTERKLQITSLERELAKLDVKNKLLTNRFNEHLEDLKSGGAKSVELEFSRAELTREEKVFELIAARQLAMQTEQHAPARVRLRQPATVPIIPITPIPYKILLLGCVAAMFAPLGLAVAREALVRRVNDVEQLRKESQLRILGEVSRFPIRPVATGTHALSNRMQREMFIFAESIDSLRTNLVLSDQLGSQSVLVVTSATSGEGKTSVATSLTGSIAAATKKPTVIIDADLRSPDVAGVLGVPNQPGLAEVLLGRTPLREALHRVGETNTYVLPAGRAKVNPHHLIQEESIQKLLNQLKQKFETIVIDTPPILGASESLVFAKAADRVLYCSLRNVSRSSQVRVAVDRLDQAGAQVAGAVLGGTPVNHYAYVYGYYSSETE